MNRRELELNRRSFLGGVAGAGGASAVGVGDSTDVGVADGPSSPAFSIPGLDGRHHVRWQFSSGEEGTVFPPAVVDGTVVTVVRREDDGGDETIDDENRFKLVALSKADKSERWQRKFEGYPSIPTVVGETVLLQTDERLLAFDASTGDERWTFEKPIYRTSQLLIADGHVFVTAIEDQDGSDPETQIHVLDARDGTERWMKSYNRTEQSYSASARLIADETLYLNNGPELLAVDTETGEVQWRREFPRERPDPVERNGETLYVWAQNTLIAVEAEGGSERWRKSFSGAEIYRFQGATTDGTVFVWGRKLFALNERTGKRRWAFDVENGLAADENIDINIVTVADGTVYTSVGTQFYAIDASNGEKRWEFDAGRRLHAYWGGVADGLVYVMGEKEVYAFDADSGEERWKYRPGGEQVFWMQLEGGSAYFATNVGTLYAVDRPSPFATAPIATLLGLATSGPGLAALGLAGVGVLAAGYRHRQRTAKPNVELGRLGRLETGPLTETYRKRVQTPDGHAVVTETQLTERADEETAAEFSEAVERWADLDVTGVLPIRAYGADPRPWFETPYAAGGSLADGWSVAAVQRVEAVSAAARTLHAAHEEGAVHGKLSPASVYLPNPGDGENARVGGWFLPDSVTEPSEGYAAPEQPDEEDRRTDVYRLAAFGYHLLTGVVPAPEPQKPSSLNPALSEKVDEVLLTGLATDPEDRYESALKFDDLFRWATLER